MLEQILHEGDIGADTANPKFAQRAVHPCNGRLRCWCPSGDLFQQAVIIASDNSARIGRAAIQANTHARRATIGGDAPVIWDEII